VEKSKRYFLLDFVLFTTKIKASMLYKLIQGRIFQIAVFSILLAVAIFLLPNFALAQVDTGIDQAAGIGLSDTDPRIVIARVIRVALGFLGIIALVLVLYAGFLYMTSAGAPDKIDKAKKILTSAAIGLIIILASFAIVSFILNFLTNSTSGTSSGPGGGGTTFGGGVPVSGNKIIEYHYPESGQQDVPRNTSIIITFKEEMNVGQLIKDNNGNGTYGDFTDSNLNGVLDTGEVYDSVNEAYVLLYKEADGPAAATLVTEVFATTADNKTFMFKPRPPDYIGSPSEEIWYTVALTSALQKANLTPAFSNPAGYYWSFLVSTIFDTTPPKITNVIPYPATTEPRNVIVQINFNEAINPLSGSGSYVSPGNFPDDFENIEINNLSDGSDVNGNFYISNKYRTIEFLTETLCGRNSCGDGVYCLPATSTIEALVKAATVIPGQNEATFPFDGIVDMASNSLDGNNDGTSQGPEDQDPADAFVEPFNANPGASDALTQGDSYRWDFGTSDEILLSSPNIINVLPAIGSNNIQTNFKPAATFDRLMMSSSMTKHSPPSLGSVALYSVPEISFWLSKTDDIVNKETTIEISHSPFGDTAEYTPEFNSGLKDIYQNCFYPGSGPVSGTNTGVCTPTPTSTPTAFPYCCDGALSTTACN